MIDNTEDVSKTLPSSQTTEAPKEEEPMKALKLRFAKGEITKEEFLEMKSMLE